MNISYVVASNSRLPLDFGASMSMRVRRRERRRVEQSTTVISFPIG